MNPLLSDSLKEILINMSNKEDIPIVNDILKANAIVETIKDLEGQKERKDCVSFLDKIIDELKIKLKNYITNEVSCLSFRGEDAFISFLPKDKPLFYNSSGQWSRDNRQTGKPARIFQKLLAKKYSCAEFEDFQNKFRAYVLNVDFKIVSGSEITDCYNENNYFSCKGTLGKSCMRYENCDYYFGVYEDNAKMLVAFKENKVAGRALIWEIDGKTYMDRVYTYVDYMYDQFIDYAEKNKWYHRENNDLLYYEEDQFWVGPENNYTETFLNGDLCIKLTRHYDAFPYMDSFRYYDCDTNTLYTTNRAGTVSLMNTDGTIPVLRYCVNCGASFEANNDEVFPDELYYSRYDGNYYCENCCWRSEYTDEYYPNNINMIYVYGAHTEWQASETEIQPDWEQIGKDYYITSEFTQEELEYIKAQNGID